MEEKLREAIKLVSMALHNSTAPYYGYANAECVNYWQWEKDASAWLIAARKLLNISVKMIPERCQQEVWNKKGKQIQQCSYKHIDGTYCKVHAKKNKETT